MNITRKAGLIGMSSVLLLAGALPAAASASSEPAKQAAVSMTTAVSVADAGDIQTKAPADTKISKDEAIAIARKILQISDDFTVDNVSFQSAVGIVPYGNIPSWNINFSQRVGDRYYGNVNASIHADTGKLLSFNRYYSNPDEIPTYPPQTDLKAAKQIAEAFAQENYAEEFKQTRYNTAFENNFKTPLSGDVRYYFRFERLVNGIPYPSDGLNVEVDGGGRVVGFYFSWNSEAKFEDPAAVISKEKALELWKQDSKLTTSYFKPYEKKGKQDGFQIAYQLQPVQLEASTGKVINGAGATTRAEAPLTEAPLGEAPKPDQSITQEQAIQAVNAAFPLPANAKLQNAYYNEYSYEPGGELQGTWNINWTLTAEEEKEDAKSQKIAPPYSKYIYASVNSRTGEIRNFYRNDYYYPVESAADDKEYKVTLEDAKAEAVEIVKKLAPHATHQLVLEYFDPNGLPEANGKFIPSYSFNFIREVDGVIAAYESVNVTIDRKTGEVNSYNNNLSNQEYPEHKPELFDPDKARELWLSQYDLELQYTPAWMNGIPSPYYGYPYDKLMMSSYGYGAPSGSADKPESVSKLVYIPVAKNQSLYSIYLDAVTGEWKNSSTGEKAVFGKFAAEDIAGHWAERELQLMVEYNALIVKDGKVNPDQGATRGELLKMLLTSVNGGYFPMMYGKERAASFADVKVDSQYFAYVEAAVDRNLIDKNPEGSFNPDATMTREEMAELIVRALGYNRLAKVPDLFRLDVGDAADITKQGHVALVLGLGIMTPSEDLFQPKEEVTRAQAATAFYRYLQKRSALQDRSFMH